MGRRLRTNQCLTYTTFGTSTGPSGEFLPFPVMIRTTAPGPRRCSVSKKLRTGRSAFSFMAMER
jgi:hypothetical protein